MGQQVIRKIELMHDLFGLSPNETDLCRNCSNLEGQPGTYFKCRCYGKSHSEATDWVKKWRGCGLFNKEYSGTPAIKMKQIKKVEIQCEGQMSLEL